ncbi:non-ribosomal peptide synthetase [Streptomyces sp. WZ-12]|uniref:non-ribosomal peptide synthetase n=1 Tax=Streptomyces sp. WZ-12 TaxID=3030210 RepID=UPI00238105F3|nr:non-ribosomal peptide synthetase [Streptomyces sp. WZ-12]
MSVTHTPGFAVSPQQRELWSRSPAVGPHRAVQLRVALDGVLDRGRLRAALSAVVRRHESLRTRLVVSEGRAEPSQVIGDSDAIELRTIEVTSGPDATAPPELEERAAVERAAVDPRNGRGFRVLLADIGADRAILLLTAHVLIADRSSLRLVAEELAVAYAGDEVQPPAADLVQYADFATWHNELLTAEEGTAERAAWSHRLAEAQGGAALGNAAPADGHQPDRRTYRPAPAPAAGALDAFAAANGLDAAAVLDAVFQVVVWRVAGERDCLVLLASSGRSHPALDHTVGALERELPLRAAFVAEQEFLSLARDTAERRRDAERRIDHLDPAALAGHRAAGRPALACFAFRVAAAPLLADGVRCTITEERRADTTDVALSCVRTDDTLAVEVRYDSALVDPATARALADGFTATLRAVLGNPAVRIGEIELLFAEERDRVRASGAGPATEVPAAAVHELFAGQAARHPEKTAVVCAGTELSYAELDARANQLARHLIASGVTRGDRVVVSIGRSPELMVALLGVLKAGAAFVPVDIGYPRARMDFVLAHAAPKMLLATGEVLDRLDEPGLPTLAMDGHPAELAARPRTPVDVPVTVADHAYLLYTSGTTGRPNGVVVPHRGLTNYLSWAATAYALHEGSGALVHTSISFDLTLTCLLGPLLAGQRVILLPESAGVTGLVSVLREMRDLSLVKLTPTHLDIVGQLVTPEEITGSVRTVVVGGEALRAEGAALFHAAGATVVNEYGPTETVVGSTAHRLDAGGPWQGAVPIGSPIAHTRAHVMDGRCRLVPDGAVGELCIGGAGVADGYLDEPHLTERRFVPDPFATDGSRLYRTGDLARRRSDGVLEFLGRADEQVKIRGVRVEPAEIESVLRAHPGVEHAVVVARRDEDPGGSSPLAGELRLVAYVVPGKDTDGPAPSPRALAEHCRTRLPELLVPTTVMVLDALPVTANGKLDRAALPVPAAVSRSAAEHAAYVVPRTDTEEILAGAVATVLGVDRVGAADNYFVLGGDSIRSVMVVSRAQSRGLDLTVAELHQNPIIADCAAAVDQRRPEPDAPTTAPFALIDAEDRARLPDEARDAFPLSLLQEGMIFHRDFAAKSAVYHAIASVRLRAPFDLDVLRTVVRQLVERHPMLRTSFDMTTYSRPLQIVHGSFETPLYFEDLRGLSEPAQDDRVSAWIDREKLRGFELHDYPLIRFMVHRRSDAEFQFTYGFHHEIVDGWSEALMITELFSHYFSLMFDEPLSIRSPKTGMSDAVALELEALRRKENYDFWNDYLADATLMRLPRTGAAAGPRADKGAREIVRIVVPVPHELSERLKQVATAHAVPLKSVLLAAHLAVMSTYGGNVDTLTYTVTNGRPEVVDGSTAIGLFVNSLALRAKMAGGSWLELIEATLRSERQSMPYRRLPMAELKRHQGNEPLAETLFFFTNYHVFDVLDRWIEAGVEHVANELYGESTFPFCGIFRLNRTTDRLEVRIEYDSLQFSAEVMESVRDCYVRVLTAIAADPTADYGVVDQLPARDRELLDRFTDGGRTPVPQRCLHALVEERTAATPDRIAVELDGTAVSYRLLNERANRIAHGLRRRGVRREHVVGVLAERSIDQIVLLLGVLKAGAAYLPLDPAQPDERTALLVTDSAARVVLAQEHLAGRVPPAAEPFVVDRGFRAVDREPTHNPDVGTGPADAAYVIYTSGSTGRPKGVVVEHRNAVASVSARYAAYAEPVDRFLLLSSFAFDSSVAGIFWTLSTGGTLVLPGEGTQLDPMSTATAIARRRPTHTLTIPSLLGPLLEQSGPRELESLVRVITAGEAAPSALYEELGAKVPGARLANEYGPTEATVWSTVWTGPGPVVQPQLPIGRPVANTRVRALDQHGRPTPVAVAGELHIGGATVARGYLGQPAATAAVFRPDPRGAVPGARRYATGDLGRFLPTGDLEFLGRNDHQVKIRGFRVEPMEIEAVLDAHPSLQRSIVMARGAESGEQQLVAYVLPEPGERPDRAELQKYVRDRLPRYMVPSTFTVLDAVPLTRTGKVDRTRLPDPDPVAELPYVAPGTETERLLVDIWSTVLKVGRVGVHHHFFDVGGESLRAMQAIAATNKLFRTRLSVRRLFDAPTIAEFATVVDEARASGTGAAPDGGVFAAAPESDQA